MNLALFAAASGMAAQQTNLDVIANNLANADVPGFKGAVASFAEIASAGRVGLGTAALGTHTLLEQGKLMKSGGPFDVAIDGPGFFEVRNSRGTVAFTRDGSFARDARGNLENGGSWRLSGIRIPSDALRLDISSDGKVTATTSHGKHDCGRIRLALFAAPEFLEPLGGTAFAATARSGRAQLISAGGAHGPQVRFGMLEQSNVSIIEAMMQILAAQRAYEANAKGVQAADEMLRIANNLNRG